MDKLVKRTAQAQRQALRRRTERLQIKSTVMNKMTRMRFTFGANELRQQIKDSRRAVKDAWELGPLAPKRGVTVDDRGHVFSPVRMNYSQLGYNKSQMSLVEQRCAWAGGSKRLNLAPNDRVVILDGRDKGKIDRIASIDTRVGTVFLEKFYRAIHRVSTKVKDLGDQPMPLPISSIRLVYPITNSDTGVTRDVMINELKAVPPNMQSPNMTFDRWHFGNKWDRLATGANIIIPWPEVKAPKQPEAHPTDTLREEVEQRTFHYNLLNPPMPESVLDELRNKYSKFRTRHENWYIEKKEAEAGEKKARHETIKLMRTPMDEFQEMQKASRAAQGEPELTEDMLEKIGEVMAKSKAAALAEAGLTEEAGTLNSTPPPGTQ